MPRVRIVLPALLALSLSACIVAPYRPGYQGYGEPIATVDLAPPAPYVEVVPAVPFAGAIWLGGYWGWNGGRHAWVPGRWDHPRAGYTWSPHRWVPYQGRWQLHGGGWVRG
jgi:hypothetical protein